MKTVPNQTSEILKELTSLGITALVVDGVLKLRGKKSSLTSELVEKVAVHKAAIIRSLSISALDVIELLAVGKINTAEYLKAWRSLENQKSN